ncbi:hypothetical protein [Piscinibacter sp. HJYY11]|nr:hypothetical protein [Piscinibacter sp. HJYY11]
MLLRKLIVFAITSGLAKKVYNHYRARKVAAAVPGRATRTTPR